MSETPNTTIHQTVNNINNVNKNSTGPKPKAKTEQSPTRISSFFRPTAKPSTNQNNSNNHVYNNNNNSSSVNNNNVNTSTYLNKTKSVNNNQYKQRDKQNSQQNICNIDSSDDEVQYIKVTKEQHNNETTKNNNNTNFSDITQTITLVPNDDNNARKMSFIFREVIQQTKYSDTQPYGHCFYLALHQLYIMYVNKSNRKKEIIIELNHMLKRSDMEQWILNCTQWELPRISLQLQEPKHRTAYSIWLIILQHLASTEVAKQKIQQVITFFNNQPNDAKHNLPTMYWGDDELLANIDLPYPYYYLGEYQGGNYHIIISTNIVQRSRNSLPYYNEEQLRTIIRCPYVLIFARRHFFLPNFYNNNTNTRFERLNQCLSHYHHHVATTTNDIARQLQPTTTTAVDNFSLIEIDILENNNNNANQNNIHLNNHNTSPLQLGKDTIPSNSIEFLRIIDKYKKNERTKYFNTPDTRHWIEIILREYPIHMNQYPHPTIKSHLKYFTESIKPIQSTICKVPGAAATRRLKAGSVIGIMSGHVVNSPHSHAIRIKNQQIAPTIGDPWAIYSLINEYIWDEDLNTAEFKANGLVVVKKDVDINEGDEIFVNYSEYYGDNWDQLRNQNILDLSDIAIQMSELFPHAPARDLINACVTSSTMPANIQRLLHDFSYGDVLYPLFPLHDFAPPIGLTTEQWIEFVFRCRWTYKNFCFRRLHDPRGWRHPTLSIMDTLQGKRQSTRLQDKPYQRYGGDEIESKRGSRKNSNKHKTNDDDGVVPLQPFPIHTNFEYLYQSSEYDSENNPDANMCLIEENITEQESNTPEQLNDFSVAHNATIVTTNSTESQAKTNNNTLKSQIYREPKRKIDEKEQPTWKTDISPYSLRIAGLNVDGCDQSSYYRIFRVMNENHIDLLMLVDTRISKMDVTIKHALAQTTRNYRMLIKPQEDTDHKYRVGGVVFVYNERIYKPTLTKLCPAGSTSILSFHFGRKKMHAIATYWPMHNIDDRSLWSRMQIRSKEEGIYQTPIEYIKSIIATKITEYTYANETCLLFGDFNTDITITNQHEELVNDKYDLHSFIEATQLYHSSTKSQLQIQSYGSIARYATNKGCSRIDYQFHNGCHVRSASCFPNDTLFDIGTMHRILFAMYDLTEYTTNKSNYRFYKTIRNVNLRNEKLVQDITQQYEHMYDELKTRIQDPNAPPTEILEEITRQSVDIVQKATSAIKPNWNVYSPQAHTSYLELKYVRKMALCCLSPNHNDIKWTKANFNIKLKLLIKDWKIQLKKHTRKNDQLYQELYKLNVESYGIQYWLDKSLNDIKLQVKDALITIKKRLHCQRRKSMRMRFSEKVREIERERKEGRIKALINLVLGSKKKSGTFDCIIKDGQVITNEFEVATETKDFFENTWFKALPDDGTHISNNINDWTIFEKTFTEFQNHFSAANIPEDIMHTLHEAIQQQPSDEKKQALTAELNRKPTIEEVDVTLKKKPANSAGGWTGMTYNMRKLWPRELQIDVFNLLLILWESDIIPSYWRVEMINLIPKGARPLLEQFRPITLLEIERKLWLSIMTNRINKMIATGGYLHPSQHGCLKKVGVDEANLGVINQYESSKELTSELYTVFWDKKRAFDRPTKPALYYSLLRIGITEKVAKTFTELGIDSKTFIKSPLLNKAMIQKNQRVIDQLAFVKEIGTPQGDTPSALMWNTFEDILLTATAKRRIGRTSFPTHDGHTVAQENSAFVDDLSSFMGTYEGIQIEADLISAFCIIFGIEISITKLKVSRLQWGNAHISGRDNILVHTAGWIPHEIKLENDGFYKTLGMTIDANPLSITQHNIVRQQILTSLAFILKAPVSNDSKIVLIKVSLYPKCIYTAKLAAWTLEQYRDLDKIFERAFRKIAKCMPTTATALLYMKTTSGGLGLPQFSTLCNKRKLKLLMRLDQQNPYRRDIAKSLIGRGARAQGIVIPAGHGALINRPMQQWWITSLLQELAELDAAIHIHGKDSLKNIYHWQVDKPNIGKLAYKTATADIGISTINEASTEVTHVALRSAQVWAIEYNDITIIKEILGFTDNYATIEYMLWTTTERIEQGTKLSLSMDNNPISPYPVGHKQTFDQFFPITCHTKLLILTDEKHDGQQLKTTATIKEIRNKIPDRIVAYSPTTHILDEILNTSRNAIAIMTDGGYDSSKLPIKQGGAIVIKHNDQLYSCINLIVDIECKSVFPIELAALTIARIASNSAVPDCKIYSDSQSSINIMNAISKKDYQKTLLAYAFNQPQLYSKNIIQWVQSHVEKRNGKWKNWTEAETGNYIADKMTLRNWRDLSNTVQLHNGNITIRKVMDIQLSTFINYMQQYNSFSLRSTTGLYHDDIEDTKLNMMEKKYLETRDNYRKQRIIGAKSLWANKVPSILRWTNRTPTTICEKAFRMKVAYNKHWTTNNKYRYTKDDTKCECPNCGLGKETVYHILFECQHIAMTSLQQSIFNQINQLILQQKKKHPLLATIIDCLRNIAYDYNNKQRNNIWTGMWTIRQIANFQQKLSNQSNKNKYKIHTIYKLSRIYTDAAKQLYNLRGQLISKTDAYVHIIDIQQKVAQTTNKITDYYNEDNSRKKKNDKKQKTSDKVEQPQDNAPSKTKRQLILADDDNISVDITSINDDNYSVAITNYNLYKHKKRMKFLQQEQNPATKTIPNNKKQHSSSRHKCKRKEKRNNNNQVNKGKNSLSNNIPDNPILLEMPKTRSNIMNSMVSTHSKLLSYIFDIQIKM